VCLSASCFLFLVPGGEEFLVFLLFVLGFFHALLLLCGPVPLALDHSWGDQTLDLGGDRPDFTVLDSLVVTDNVLPDVIGGRKVEQLPDVGSPLGSETLWDALVGQSGDLTISLLDNSKIENRQASINNATVDGFTFALTGSAAPVARVSLAEKETHTSSGEDSLLHGETLLVVSTTDTEDVSLEFLSKA